MTKAQDLINRLRQRGNTTSLLQSKFDGVICALSQDHARQLSRMNPDLKFTSISKLDEINEPIVFDNSAVERLPAMTYYEAIADNTLRDLIENLLEFDINFIIEDTENGADFYAAFKCLENYYYCIKDKGEGK